MFVFDNHCHLAPGSMGPVPHMAPEVMIDAMKRYGISKCYVQGWPDESGQSIEALRANNDYVAMVVKRYPREFPCGIAHSNPRLGDVGTKELERALGQLGLRGVKLMASYQNFHILSELTSPICELCEEYDVPIQIHSDLVDARNNPLTCAELASRFPKVTFIVVHTPREPINDAKNMTCAQALRQSNIVLDTSIGFDSEIEVLAKKTDPDRIVFGSDYPAFHWRFAKAKVEVCDLPESVKAKIFGLNLARILGVEVE